MSTHRNGPSWLGSGQDSPWEQLLFSDVVPLCPSLWPERGCPQLGSNSPAVSSPRSWQVNIIPIIAKADTISKSELHKFKIKIMGELVSNGVQIYQFPTDDEAVAEINAVMNVSVEAGLQGSGAGGLGAGTDLWQSPRPLLFP